MTFHGADKALGAYHGILGVVMFLTTGMAANAHTVLDTMVFASIGASVGFLTTWLWKRLFKHFKINTD